jgi:oxygen-independent coproporphyrinogen III oxidase
MDAVPELHESLLQRYDRPGPRYTSYPTAPHFRGDFGIAELRHQAAACNAQRPLRPLSLYVHVPYCQSPCFYCGCNRIITRDLSKGEPYVQRLLKEAQLVAPLFARERPVVQLHLGGGTPNFLQTASLERLIAGLRNSFTFSDAPDRDFSIELDPRSLPEDSEQYARHLSQLGFNRVSLGVQDFDEDVQRAVNRLQTSEQTLDLIDACRDQGFRSVNIDLIYGLPRQSSAGFRRTLRTVIAARPDRIAIYGYAHLPAMFKAQRQIRTADLPEPRARLALLRLAIEELGAFGYRYIGMDHFALPQDELVRAQDAGGLQRNFMGYTTHAGCDLVGLGASAISSIGHSYSQNFRELRDWERAIDAGTQPLWRGLALTLDDRVRAAVIEQLMCHGRVDIQSIETAYGIVFKTYFADALLQLAPQATDGLIEYDDNRILATPAGRLLLRNLAMCFDQYLPRPVMPAPMSQVI